MTNSHSFFGYVLFKEYKCNTLNKLNQFSYRRYIRNKDHNRDNSEIIDVSSVQHKLFGLHECMLCEDRLVAKTGKLIA